MRYFGYNDMRCKYQCCGDEEHGREGCQIMIMIDIEMTLSGITRTDQQLGKNRENENK